MMGGGSEFISSNPPTNNLNLVREGESGRQTPTQGAGGEDGELGRIVVWEGSGFF